MPKHLSSSEVVGGYYRLGRAVYAETAYSCFNYDRYTAHRIAWRFYWLRKNA